MRRWKLGLAVLALATAVTLFKIPEGLAEENYESWAVLKNPFESTGGGGVMIGEYNPVIVGSKCVTNFTATLPDGKVYYNVVEFEIVQVQGGTLLHQRRLARPRRQLIGHHAVPRVHQGRRDARSP